MELTKEQQQLLISEGIRFCKTVASVYGPEEGTKLWTTIGNTLNNGLKNKIFMAMIEGNFDNNVTFKYMPAAENNAVAVIRSIRIHTGMTLKAAKDMWDFSKIRYVTIETESNEVAQNLARELTQHGCEVNY